MTELVFYDPGHFHAALLLGAPNSRLSPDIHAYGPAGPDLERFAVLVEIINGRLAAADRWRLTLHPGDNGLTELIAAHPGAIVVLAGKNAPRLAVMKQLHDGGFAILADKPWITDSRDLPLLDQVTSGLPLAMDIMTSRFDTGARLRHRIITDDDIFGGFESRAGDLPALEMSSLHHLCKLAAGEPLIRPAWHYDISVQGDGMVDIQSHMSDQALWLVADDQRVDFAQDFELIDARRWATAVPLTVFRESTGEERFPVTLQGDIADDVLQLACNGEVNYRLRGHWVRQKAEWAARAPDGGGDSQVLIARGRNCDLVLRQDQSTGFQADLQLWPAPGIDLPALLDQKFSAWQPEFPGLSFEATDNGVRLRIPDAIKISHEDHFPLLLEHYLDLFQQGQFPEAIAFNTRARYSLLAHARDLALAKDRSSAH